MEGQQVLAKLVFNASPGQTGSAPPPSSTTPASTRDWLSKQRADGLRVSCGTTPSSRRPLDTQRTTAVLVRPHPRRPRPSTCCRGRSMGSSTTPRRSSTRKRFDVRLRAPRPRRCATAPSDHEQVGYGASAPGSAVGRRPPTTACSSRSAPATRPTTSTCSAIGAEVNATTGQPVPTSLIFPTKYFPESDVVEAGGLSAGRDPVRPRHPSSPGVRYDHFSLDANQADPVFVASLNPEAADFSDGALAPKIGMAARLSDVRDPARAVRRRLPGAALQRHQHRFSPNPRGGYTDAAECRAPGRDERQPGGRHPDRVRPRELRDSAGSRNRLRRLHRDDGHRLQPDGRGCSSFQSQNLDQAEIRGGRAARRGVPERQRDDPRELRPDRRCGDSPGRRRRSAAGGRETPLGSIAPGRGG